MYVVWCYYLACSADPVGGRFGTEGKDSCDATTPCGEAFAAHDGVDCLDKAQVPQT